MRTQPADAQDIQAALNVGDGIASSFDADGRRYWSENSRRIAYAVATAAALLRERLAISGAAPSVLDVGPAMELPQLAAIVPDARYATMGWMDYRYRLAREVPHTPLDLNDTVDASRCPPPIPHDLVLLLEVIEHVHVSPLCVLRYLRDWVKPGGHLIVSTPNAAWLRNRWKMLWGENPFEPLRDNLANPGHFRELTRCELRSYLAQAGFAIEHEQIGSWYRFSSSSGRRFSALSKLLPQSLRHDMFFVARRTT